jgi:hypothetical protein
MALRLFIVDILPGTYDNSFIERISNHHPSNASAGATRLAFSFVTAELLWPPPMR